MSKPTLITSLEIPDWAVEMGVAVIKSYVGKKANLFVQTVTPTAEQTAKLNTCSVAQLCAYAMFFDKQKTLTKRTPFAIGDFCIDSGFGIVPKVNEEGNGTLEITNGLEKAVLPVMRAKVNTTPIKEMKIEAVPFEPAIHRIAVIASTFFESKLGQPFAPTLDEKTLTMMSFDKIVPGHRNLRPMLFDLITEVMAAEKIDKLKNCSGVEFTDYLYSLFFTHRKLIPNILPVLAESVLCKENGVTVPYVDNVDRRLVFHSPAVALPHTIADAPVKPNDVSYIQALTCLDATRSMRGRDMKERGGLPRMAYMRAEFSPLYSEVCYWATDLRKMNVMSHAEIILLANSEVTTVKQIILALDAMDFHGTLRLVGTAPASVAKRKQDAYFSPSSNFRISSYEAYEVLRHVGKDAVILDLRVVYKKSGKIADMEIGANAAVLARFEDLKAMPGRVIVRVPLCGAASTWHCYAGVRIHNLVGYAERVEDKDGKQIVTESEEMRKIYYQSVVANILRNYRAFHVLPLPLIASKMKVDIPYAELLTWKREYTTEILQVFEIDGVVEYVKEDEEVANVPPVRKPTFNDLEFEIDGTD